MSQQKLTSRPVWRRRHRFPAQTQEPPGSFQQMNPVPDHGEETYQGHDRLKGMKALITGGDSGIGRAVAIAFAREGADVAINYLEPEESDAQDTIGWIEKAGRKGVRVPGDIQDRETCEQVVAEAVKQLGGLDILVNNAGFHWDKSEPGIEHMAEEHINLAQQLGPGGFGSTGSRRDRSGHRCSLRRAPRRRSRPSARVPPSDGPDSRPRWHPPTCSSRRRPTRATYREPSSV